MAISFNSYSYLRNMIGFSLSFILLTSIGSGCQAVIWGIFNSFPSCQHSTCQVLCWGASSEQARQKSCLSKIILFKEAGDKL